MENIQTQAIVEEDAWVWEPLLHPDDLKLTSETWNKALREGSDYQMEFRLRNSEGEYRWFLARALPLKDPQGNIVKWFGSSTDIHDQKIGQEQHKLQAKIIENINEGVLVADENGIIIYTNPAQDRLFRYNPGELLGQHVSVQHAFSLEENQTIVSEIYNKLEIDDAWSGIIKNKRKDGTTFISYNTISSLHIYNKKLYVSIRRDITEEIKNKEALEYQSQLNKTITDNATSCLIMMNARGYCTFINPAGEKMFGYTFEEIKEKPLHYMIHHHHPDGSFYPMEECPIDKALAENFDTRAHQDVFIRKDGTFFPVSCAASPIFEGGVPVATVIEVRDVTEEKRAQKEIIENNAELNKKNIELERINKDLDNFIYTASHDLKAHVSNIEGLIYSFKDIIKAGQANPDEQSEIINLIENSISRFKETIEDLTEISKVQKDLANDVQEVELNYVFQDVVTSIRKMVESSNTSFKINFNECKKIRFSKINLRSLLFNLITNAIKYRSPERNPFIEVSCKKTETYTLLYVKDNGLGIKSQQQDKIFGMFKRMHKHVEGTGIGLYIVKRMIENAGGKIEVESEEGKGSTFKVYFKR